MISEIATPLLDRARPLWELWLLEGLAGGRLAAVVKVHHAVADGVASAALIAGTAVADARTLRIRPSGPGSPSPCRPAGRLIRDALGDWLRALVRLPGMLAQTLGRLRVLLAARRRARVAAPVAYDTPGTPFNKALRRRRIFATASLSIGDCQRVKEAFGVTLNDVVLALCGGSLRRWLVAHGQIPSRPLIASVPVAADPAGGAPRLDGNRVAYFQTALRVDLDDPVERLLATRDVTAEAKRELEIIGRETAVDWMEYLPPVPYTLTKRIHSRLRLADLYPSPSNLVVSNVAGPRAPLYWSGARLAEFYSVGPLSEGIGLNVTVWSYCDRMYWALLACRDQVPDLAAIAAGMADELRRLVDAADRVAPAAAASRGAVRGDGAASLGCAPARVERRASYRSVADRRRDARAERARGMRWGAGMRRLERRGPGDRGHGVAAPASGPRGLRESEGRRADAVLHCAGHRLEGAPGSRAATAARTRVVRGAALSPLPRLRCDARRRCAVAGGRPPHRRFRDPCDATGILRREHAERCRPSPRSSRLVLSARHPSARRETLAPPAACHRRSTFGEPPPARGAFVRESPVKIRLIAARVAIALSLAAPAWAQTDDPTGHQHVHPSVGPASGPLSISLGPDGARADAHAPIGVMGDHLHPKGGWMLSYRFMHMEMDGNLDGSDDIGATRIATTVPNRFFGMPRQPPTLRVVPKRMSMDMHMFGAMVAPADWVTLTAMASYVEKEMDHVTFRGPKGTAQLGDFTTRSDGFGDLNSAGSSGSSRTRSTTCT